MAPQFRANKPKLVATSNGVFSIRKPEIVLPLPSRVPVKFNIGTQGIKEEISTFPINLKWEFVKYRMLERCAGVEIKKGDEGVPKPEWKSKS